MCPIKLACLVTVSKIIALGSVTLPISSWITEGIFCLVFKIPAGGINEATDSNLSAAVVPSTKEPPFVIKDFTNLVASAAMISADLPLWVVLSSSSSKNFSALAITSFFGLKLPLNIS